MPKSKVLYLSGKGSWFKLVEPDEYRGTKNWKFDFYPDDKSWAAIKAQGIQKKVKENEDGKFISLARPVAKKWKLKDGESPEFDPPRILGPDDQPWDTSVIIGNGSAVTIKIEVYQTSMGPGTRLDVVRVDDHVPYEGSEGLPPAPVREVTGNVPARGDGATAVAKKVEDIVIEDGPRNRKTTKTQAKDLEDEIPF